MPRLVWSPPAVTERYATTSSYRPVDSTSIGYLAEDVASREDANADQSQYCSARCWSRMSAIESSYRLLCELDLLRSVAERVRVRTRLEPAVAN